MEKKQAVITRRGLMRAGAFAAAGAHCLDRSLAPAIAQPVAPIAVLGSPLMPLQPGVRAGDLAFAVADARGPDGTLGGASDAATQTVRSLDNLRTTLRVLGQDLEHVV